MVVCPAESTAEVVRLLVENHGAYVNEAILDNVADEGAVELCGNRF